MPSIEKRGKNSWRLVVEAGRGPDGKRKKCTKTIRVEDPALLRTTKKLQEYLEAEWYKFKAEVEAGTYRKPERMTLAQFVDEWREKFAQQHYKPSTMATYELHIQNHILPALGHHRLDELKPMHIITFLADLHKPGARKDGRGEQLSGRSIQYIYAVLRSILTQATVWKVISENPMADIPKPKAEKPKAQFYETEEVEYIIEKLYELPDTWRLLFLTAILGGLRRGELIALQWKDVDFEDCTIHVQRSISFMRNGEIFEKGTKNEEDRVVDMPAWYMDEMRKFRKEWVKQKLIVGNKWEGGDKEYVFHSGLGRPLYYSYPTEKWRDFCEQYDIRYMSLHKLRHTSLTILIEKGAPMKAIQERAGHKQAQTTNDIYGHVTKKLSREVAKMLDDLRPKHISK